MDDELLPITEVVRASGISSRTLRHYDAIGLLRPAHVAPNGYRFYGNDELARLQRILLLRELGLGLEQIKAIVDDGSDPLDALRRHRDALERRRGELDALLVTIDSTITNWQKGLTMSVDELFAGFDPQRQAAYEHELTDRYGDDVRATIDESKRRTSGWRPRDYIAVQEAFSSVDLRTTQLIDAGAEPGDAPVQELIGEHYEIVARFWTPDAEQYARLGHLYVDHPEFRARYDAIHPSLAEFLCDAMAVYAETVLN